MNNKDQFRRWGGISAIASGVIFLVPLIFYFSLLPAAGSSATHAKNPSSFLPWMAAQGDLRIALWWIVCVAFMLMLFGTPSALKSILRETNPVSGRISELAGILGAFTLVFASLILAAGEMPIAKAYVGAASESKTAIVALYEWQRLATALLFDVLGFGFLGVWICIGSAAGLRSGSLPKPFGIFGLVTAVLLLCFALGYALQISWLGETGIGAAAFLALPAWLIWLGVICVRTEHIGNRQPGHGFDTTGL